MRFFQPSRSLIDPPLALALEEHFSEVRNELETEGCPQPTIQALRDLESLAGVQPYQSLFPNLRRRRLEALLNQRVAAQPAKRNECLKDLVLREIELCGAPGAVRLTLDRKLADFAAGTGSETGLITLTAEMWRDDAVLALEQRQVQQLVRQVGSAVILFFFVVLCFTQLGDILYTIANAPIAARTIREIMSKTGNLLASKFVMCGLLGLLGATFSIWLDPALSPRLPHWLALRRSGRVTRCWGGVTVGLLISVLAPVFLGEGFAKGSLVEGQTAPAVVAASSSPPQAGMAVLQGTKSDSEPSGSTDRESALIRLYAFSLVFGFSQDLFFKKLQAFGSG
jgi:hypothetical protein